MNVIDVVKLKILHEFKNYIIMKFVVTILKTERISYEVIEDVKHSKIFEDTNSLSDIMKWANQIKSTSYIGSQKADVTDLQFSKLCE